MPERTGFALTSASFLPTLYLCERVHKRGPYAKDHQRQARQGEKQKVRSCDDRNHHLSSSNFNSRETGGDLRSASMAAKASCCPPQIRKDTKTGRSKGPASCFLLFILSGNCRRRLPSGGCFSVWKVFCLPDTCRCDTINPSTGKECCL